LGEGRANWRIIRKGGCGRGGDDDDDDDDDNILSAACDGLDPYHSPLFYLAIPNIKTYQRPPSMLFPAFLFLPPTLKNGSAQA